MDVRARMTREIEILCAWIRKFHSDLHNDLRFLFLVSRRCRNVRLENVSKHISALAVCYSNRFIAVLIIKYLMSFCKIIQKGCYYLDTSPQAISLSCLHSLSLLIWWTIIVLIVQFKRDKMGEIYIIYTNHCTWENQI